ncbi:MAG: signal peptidase, partial [Solirubrobacteraceae bacterium]|nr:signal peptidase [Solirubrobacteraceae bacterium]
MQPAAAWRRAALVVAAVLASDQISKQLAASSISGAERRSVFPGVELVHVRNNGVAFGVLSGGGGLVLVVIAVALVALVVYFASHADRPLVWLPTGLLIGGALGNLLDRLGDGEVTDFIKLPLWPAFNLADVAIT